MPQDAFTLKYLCEELNDVFAGGKINRIIQPTSDEVIFTVYTGKSTRKLYISVNPSCPRIGICDEERESPLTAPNFCMLLRKHLLSATINSVSLLDFDRIVKIDLTASSEFFDTGKKTLYAELMGRYSNIILTEEGKVLGGNRGINFFDNGVRPLIVGRSYSLPPSGDKKAPSDSALTECFGKAEGCVSDIVCKYVQGIAVDTAKEIEKEYTEKYGNIKAETLFDFINSFVYGKKKQPCIIRENGTAKDVCAFPYSTLGGEYVFFPSLAEAENIYFKEKQTAKKLKEQRERVSAVLLSARKKLKKRLALINARLSDANDCEKDRLKGELILANIYKIKQGDERCVLDNYYDGTQISITLDPTLSPSKNAERYYKKYNKAKRTLAAQEPQRQIAEEELNYIEAVSDELSLAENLSDVLLVKEELTAAGYISENKTPLKRKKSENIAYRKYIADGFVIKVGRNNVENDALTFSAKGTDVWLHAKDYHSSHVIIETLGKEPSDSALRIAAEICAYYSKGREGGKTEVVFTKKKFVKKPPKSKLGFCTYTDFKSLTVIPHAHTELLA